MTKRPARRGLRDAASARADQDAPSPADTTPPAPEPPQTPHRGAGEVDAPTGQRTRLTVYLPVETYEVLAAVALQRKVQRGGKGHASASRLVLDLIEERMPELREELGRS